MSICFARLREDTTLRIAMTVTTVDTELARMIEVYAPRPDLRMRAVKTLAAAGIRVMISCSPIMPLINDTEPSIDAVARAAARAGARGLWANPLFLKPCAREVFIPFLEERFPLLVRRYKERYDRAAYLRGGISQDHPRTRVTDLPALRVESENIRD